MVNNKKIMALILIIILCIFLVIVINKKDINNEKTDNKEIDVLYNNDTGMFYITDENGEVVQESKDEGSLYIYTIDSNYDTKGS